jgi:1,4-alpha-glucan branching enzyme
MPTILAPIPRSDEDSLEMLVNAKCHDPFAVLGRCEKKSGKLIRVMIPQCKSVQLGEERLNMVRIPNTDIFEIEYTNELIPTHYKLNWEDDHGESHSEYDPYSFTPIISEYDIYLFNQGRHWHVYRILGAHHQEIDGVQGVQFAVWAPNAERVSVVSDFNQWDGRRHPMQSIGSSGVWALFIPEIDTEIPYKFEIRNRETGQIQTKADPYAQQFEMRPKTASLVSKPSTFQWNDKSWINKREKAEWLHEPMSIYEVHLGSWQRNDENNFLGYKELADRLIPYVRSLGFTHIELLPITEHPFDDSWGYQSLGYFAPTSRFGTPDDFRYFVDQCHENNIGVLLDWVPAHFPKDDHGLRNFDGTALYEHSDVRMGEHPDWGTLIYNYGRDEVRNFLLSSAVFWLEEFHLDGLRVDAVASLLYLDYSREEGEWLPNRHGGNENLEAIDFIRELNSVTHGEFPGTLILAEESTAWPQVTKPTWTGGLGFSMKWNMGWMHDTLKYMQKDPIHRKYEHNNLTFGLLYAFHENFILPFSHDEVVHGKSSLLNKMPGDEWQKFANLRLLYTYMFTYPGKKLLFMGCEFGQGTEWNHHESLDWYVLQYANHKGVSDLVRDLNKLYVDSPPLHKYDFYPQGFQWINCNDDEQSVISYLRKFGEEVFVIVLNLTPVSRDHYRIGVPYEGEYNEIFNSDSTYYAGSNVGNISSVKTDEITWMDFPYSLELVLPPLGAIILKPAIKKLSSSE